MYCIIGIVFVIIGMLMLFSPETVFKMTESWKSYSSGDPSDLYIISTRIGGGIVALVGIVSIVVQFLK